MRKTIKYLSGRGSMAKFDSLMKATFNPPRNWTLLEDLKFYSDILTKDQAEMLRWCGVKVHNSTKTKQYIITIPKKYVTDMASVPRGCWAFIAPFDVARAAVVHDILYEKINTQYKIVNESAAAEEGEKIQPQSLPHQHASTAEEEFKKKNNNHHRKTIDDD